MSLFDNFIVGCLTLFILGWIYLVARGLYRISRDKWCPPYYLIEEFPEVAAIVTIFALAVVAIALIAGYTVQFLIDILDF